MKYILFGDFDVLKKQKKIIIAYTLSLIIFCLFTLEMSKEVIINNINLKSLGMILNNDFLDILMYFLNFSFYIFVIVLLFLSDIRKGGQNIFSRLSKRVYFVYKLISISIIVLASKFIYHLITSLICKLSLNLNMLLVDFNYTILIGLLIIIAIIFSSVKFNVLYMLLLSYVILAFININLLSSINVPLFILVLINMILIIICIYMSKFLFFIYERND